MHLHSKGYQVRRRPSVTMNDQNYVQRINLIEFLGRQCPFRVQLGSGEPFAMSPLYPA
jgi:hypothetical protein